MFTNTAYFLRPTVKFDGAPPSVSSYENAYLGDYVYSGENYGENLFLLYPSDVLSEDLKQKLEAHPQFVTTYQPQDGKVMFVYKLDEATKEKVVKPVIDGQYSKVDRTYVESNFPVNSTTLTTNRMVFDKHPRLAQMWEERIGVALPEDAEVWSKPKKEVEIYRYPVDEETLLSIS